MGWLPDGKRAAVVFSIDDIHPGTSKDAYEAGGDLEQGALGHLLWLLNRHPKLGMTLFVTADWREISPIPTRKLASKIPIIKDRVFLSPVLPKGTMRLDRHPPFSAFIAQLPRTDLALHGLHHVHRGARLTVEFQAQSRAVCGAMLKDALKIFNEAELQPVLGLQPPAWELSENLLRACADCGLLWVSSSRDVKSPVSISALAKMSGRTGIPLFAPTLLPVPGRRGVVHLPSNFQATSRFQRAVKVIEAGGVLSVKAHIVKDAMGHIALDGVDALYCNYLDLVFSELEDRFGDEIFWTRHDEVAKLVHAHHALNEGMHG